MIFSILPKLGQPFNADLYPGSLTLTEISIYISSLYQSAYTQQIHRDKHLTECELFLFCTYFFKGTYQVISSRATTSCLLLSGKCLITTQAVVKKKACDTIPQTEPSGIHQRMPSCRCFMQKKIRSETTSISASASLVRELPVNS